MKEQQPRQREATLSGTFKCSDISGLNPDFDFGLINPQSILSEVEHLINEDNISEGLKARIIDLSTETSGIEFLFKKDGTGCIPVGDIVVVKGKQKAGKSTLIACWATALLKGEYMGFTAMKKDCKVIYVDTEQNPANTNILVKKVHSLCCFPVHQNHTQFTAINLRGDTPMERIKFVYEAVKKLKPDLLILDGAKDLINGGDINDSKSSSEIVQSLMTLTKNYRLSIVTVLHENKNDTNLRGHIGTELLNKCSECWQVKKVDTKFESMQTDSRNQPAKGFSFMLNSEALPVHLEHVPRISVKEKTDAKKLKTLRQCFKLENSIKYTELVNMFCKNGNCKETTAQTYITIAFDHGYLIKELDGRYKFNYQKTEQGSTPIPPTPL